MKEKQEKGTSAVCFLYYQGFHPLLYREAMALREAGFEVDIICLKAWKDEKFLSGYEGLKIFKIQRRSAAEKSLAAYFAGLLMFFAKAFMLLAYLGIKNRYKVVHVTSPPDIMVFAALVPRLLGARVLLDIHDIGPELFMRKLNVGEKHPVISLLKLFEKISCRFAGHVITVTHIWRDKLVMRSVPKEKCSVLLNVPDDKLFVFRPQRDEESPGTFNLYYHGSLEEHFGVDTLLAAMPLIKAAIPNVMLHIYAAKKGRILDDCLSYARQHGLEGFVTFHDAVPFYQLPALLTNADIGMVPTKNSVFADEAVSMKSLEYIFLGIPIVISGTTAHRYYYDETMVRFFEPCSTGDLARAVTELYRDRTLRNAMVQNTRRFIEDNSWTKVKTNYVRIVSEMALGTSPSQEVTREDRGGPLTPGALLERAVSISLATVHSGLRSPRATILAYHEIAADASASVLLPDSVTAGDFERQMATLREGPFNVVSLEKLIALMESGEAIPPATVVVTFDDGYRSTYTRALPALLKYDIPATVFLAAAFIGLQTPFPWLAPGAMDEPGTALPLNWEEVRELRAAGVEIGSHTFTHPFLPMLDCDGIDYEIRVSRMVIEDNTGQTVRLFALPFSFPLSHRAWPSFEGCLDISLRKWSYKCCCTLLRGSVAASDNPYALRRISVGKWDDARMFRAKLSGCYSWTRVPQYFYQSFFKKYSRSAYRPDLSQVVPPAHILTGPEHRSENVPVEAATNASGGKARETKYG
jgi:glycosyltransferase involved in cell wall biosynthesis